MTRVNFGFTLPIHRVDAAPRGAFVPALERTIDRIAGRFDSAWAIDHLQYEEDEGLLEGYTSVAYLAGRYPQLKFGNIVLCQSYRNPGLLAKMAASLQILSRGRFILGLGAGWHAAEYRAYGYEFPPPGVRVAQLEETLQIIRRLWTEKQVTFEGKYYGVREAICEPKPDPQPPVMVGAYGPKMLRLTAKYADDWNIPSISPRAYRPRLAELEKACTEIGRDPAAISRSWSGGCACARTQAEADALAGERLGRTDDDFDLIGTPLQIVEYLQAFIDLGVSTFMLDFAGFPSTDGLELFMQEVIPEIQETR